MFSTLTKFLTEEAADDNEFQNGFTEEQPDPDVKNWILHRSYSFQTDIIHEQLNVELRDEDDIPHVRCALTLTLGSRDTPHSDVRGLIFKPHAWLGPELNIIVGNGQSLSRASELCVEPSGSTQVKDDHNHRAETRILLVLKSYLKGCHTLVQTPTKAQQRRLAGVRNCIEAQTSDDKEDTVRLAPILKNLKRDGIKPDKLCSETFKRTKKIEQQSASTHNVGCYLTGITQHRDLLPPGQCPTPKSKDTPAYECGRGVERIMELTSRLAELYDDDIANATFTFLELGACGVTRLGKAALGNEKFFYDALFSLIDLSWRKLTAVHPDEAQDGDVDLASGLVRRTASRTAADKNLPIMNPFACYSSYTEADYNFACEKLNQRSFLNAPRELSYEVSFGTIISQARRAAKSSPPDKSRTFILYNAKRLAKYITNEQRRNRIMGYQDNVKDAELALRILEGKCSPPELTAVSMAVVHIIVDILLDRCPLPKKRGPPSKQDKISKKSRTLKILPEKHAGSPRLPHHQPSQWPNGVFQSETEPSLQAQSYNPHFNFNNPTSTNLGQFTPVFGGPDQSMHSDLTNALGQVNFDDGVNIDALLSQFCTQFDPNGNWVQAPDVNTNSILPTPVSQDDPDDLLRNGSLDTMI
ncbi:hypothetical protein VFPPC_11603 [Pochonia chlamydosporia 170]|uniref:Uncharacterized protein n=1 Tax=Pochonia chlamydosporia 170 TaxID=1380566 RepID=A0A179EZ88_METCM|nr:hypothetical protein VFPPC_11603 [Pochonia chlamydosporia 170]OAQ58153.1 hypothetical protein VFPPC_11603 [Pochonia chlamydosporia 170]